MIERRRAVITTDLDVLVITDIWVEIDGNNGTKEHLGYSKKSKISLKKKKKKKSIFCVYSRVLYILLNKTKD